MADPNEIATGFLEFFNGAFDSEDRTQLAPLYQETSMLTYEGTQMQGTDAIINFFANPELTVKEGGSTISRFQTRTHVTTCDAQPSGESGVLVFVTGNMETEGEEHPQKFSHVFTLVPTDDAQFWIQNQIFRLQND